MLYIVEIPHQRPASCWVATNEADFCARMAEACQRQGYTPDDGTFSSWRDYLANDLHTLHVFATDAEAIAALDDATFSHHQGARARAALEAKLRTYGILPEPQEADECPGPST